MELLCRIFIFIFGTCAGSFLNVCIYRLPRKESVVHPRSRCPHCKKQIAWYDNIPLLSYLVLRARCRHCQAPISFRYFAVELITGALLLFLYLCYGLSALFFVYAVFFAALIVITFIDFDIKEIPDVISLPGIVIGLIVSSIVPSLHRTLHRPEALVSSLLGILIGGGIIYAVGVLGKVIFKKEAMGGGDVKLLAMIGAFIGWKLALITFFLAPFLGIGYGMAVKLRTGSSLIPYGPFLSLAGFIAVFWGEHILKLFVFY